MKKIDYIKKIDLFENDVNLDLFNIKKYYKNNILFYEDNSEKYIYFLIAGACKNFKSDSLFLFKSNLFTPLNIFDGVNLFTCEIVSDSEILIMKKEDFLIHVDYKKLFDFNLLQQNMFCDVINNNLVYSAIERVEKLLFNDLNKFNAYKRSDIAASLNLSSETLSRCLKKLVDNKIISISRGVVLLE